jgi:hypothetical protein
MSLLTVLEVILELREQVDQRGLDERRIANPVVERSVSRLEQAEGARPESKPFFLGCDTSSRRKTRVLFVHAWRLDQSLEYAGHGPAEGLELLLR